MDPGTTISAKKAHPQLDLDLAVPLVVDLDGTMVLTDSLHESFIRLFFLDPLAALRSLAAIADGRAAFKKRLVGHGLAHIKSLPQRDELVELLHAEKARGRKLHLVTGADQKVAEEVGGILGVFDSVLGSDGQRNLKGKRKGRYLSQNFTEGFIYAGDHASDIPVFKAARAAILCDANARTTAAVRRLGIPILASLRRPAGGIRAWFRALRVHQYAKNILIFVPLFLGHAYTQPPALLATVLAFLILCITASGTYIVNDLADLDADRRHETKRNRPFASGALPVAQGFVVAPIIIACGLGAAYLLSVDFALALLAYLALTLAYSFQLKRIPLLDVFIIGILFTLRVVMGAAVLGPSQSPWLLSFALAFFLSLAMAKRHCEVMRANNAEIEEIAGRGYVRGDWPLTLTFGIGTGLVSMLIMLLYLTNDVAPSGFYTRPGWLYAIPALLTLWLMRVWLLSNRMQLDDDPVVFAVRDPASLAIGALTAAAFFSAF